MSDKKNNVAIEAVATLKLNLDVATEALNLITEENTADEKKTAQDAYDAAKSAYEKATAVKATVKTKEKLVKGVFILSPTARFKLGYSPGEEAALPELQANELDEAGYFKISK